MSKPSSLSHFAVAAFLPVGMVYAVLAPFWLARSSIGFSWLATVSELFTAVLLPAYLAWLACRVVLRRVSAPALPAFLLLLCVLSVGLFLHYSLWGIASGRFWAPDYMTVVIFRFCALAGLGILVLPPLGVFCYRWVSQRFSRAA